LTQKFVVELDRKYADFKDDRRRNVQQYQNRLFINTIAAAAGLGIMDAYGAFPLTATGLASQDG
jgi:hypothetical protein